MPRSSAQLSRERVLDAAIGLMRRGGFHAAGVNEIVAESGAAKGSLYYLFPEGKRQIASAALALYADRVCAYIDASLASASAPDAKVEALFRAVAERFEAAGCRQSCAAGAASLDLTDDLEVVRGAIGGMFEACVAVIASHFRARDVARSRSFASLLLTTIEGAYVRGRAECSARPIHEASDWLAALAVREFGQQSRAPKSQRQPKTRRSR